MDAVTRIFKVSAFINPSNLSNLESNLYIHPHVNRVKLLSLTDTEQNIVVWRGAMGKSTTISNCCLKQNVGFSEDWYK